MTQARRTSDPGELLSTQEIIVASLRRLHIDFSANLWRLNLGGTREAITTQRIDWTLFFSQRRGRAHTHLSLADTYKWLAACWLTGCGGEVRAYTLLPVRDRLYAVRHVLHSLQADAGSLPTLTPRQLQDAVRKRLNIGRGSALSVKRLRVTLQAVADLYRLRRILPIALARDPFPPDFVRSVLAR